MFTGEYRHAIDGKGRVAVPARFRAQLDEGAFVSRWLDNCLAIFPRAAWDDLAARVAALPTGNATAREFARFLFGSAFEVELDARAASSFPQRCELGGNSMPRQWSLAPAITRRSGRRSAGIRIAAAWSPLTPSPHN